MKHIFVTGVTRGIGKGITYKLLEEEFRVTGTGHSTAFPEDFTDHKHFKGLNVDLADVDSLNSVIKPLFESDNYPDVVINNAGVSQKQSITSADTPWIENWHNTHAINLKAPAIISKWAINNWLEDNGGILINISSRAAHRGDTDDFASYAASKGGLSAFTKSIARSLGKKNITAFDIAPGFVETEMMEQVKETYPDGYIEDELSLNTMVQPENIGDLIAFIASGKARHLTGQTLNINSGSHLF